MRAKQGLACRTSLPNYSPTSFASLASEGFRPPFCIWWCFVCSCLPCSLLFFVWHRSCPVPSVPAIALPNRTLPNRTPILLMEIDRRGTLLVCAAPRPAGWSAGSLCTVRPPPPCAPPSSARPTCGSTHCSRAMLYWLGLIKPSIPKWPISLVCVPDSWLLGSSHDQSVQTGVLTEPITNNSHPTGIFPFLP